MHSPCQPPASTSGLGATHWWHAGYVPPRQPPPPKAVRTLLQFLPSLRRDPTQGHAAGTTQRQAGRRSDRGWPGQRR